MSKILTSTHGKLMLQELSIPLLPSPTRQEMQAQIKEKINLCLSYLKVDPNSCILRVVETGNTAYHLLVGSDFPEDFIFPLLEAFWAANPIGLSMKNKFGNLPLHCSLYQPVILESVASRLLELYPSAASVKNNSELIPLFFAVMRDNASFELCKALCKAFPDGVRTLNHSKSLPLHFACKRKYPNLLILQMLLRRYSAAAATVNDYGMLPLHVLATHCYDLNAIRMVVDAYPEAIQTVDRQGRTCLHLAVLAVGKDHEAAIAREVEEEENLMKDNQRSTSTVADTETSSEDDDEPDAITSTADASANNDIFERKEGKSREILRYFITKFPMGLVTLSNFQSIPVDTVLEKAKTAYLRQKSSNSKVSKLKSVRVYGLYDDPPTARLLICSHKHYAMRGLIPPVPSYYQEVLKDLNWLSRRMALQLSYLTASGKYLPISQKPPSHSSTSNRSSTVKTSKNQRTANTKKAAEMESDSRFLDPSSVVVIHNNNLLARLRYGGFTDLVVMCISYV